MSVGTRIGIRHMREKNTSLSWSVCFHLTQKEEKEEEEYSLSSTEGKRKGTNERVRHHFFSW